jgi:hypothetical protein
MRKNVLKELSLAKKKLLNHNKISDIVFKGDWVRFFINCYLYCNSQSYGNKWTNKLAYHFKYIYELPSKLERGDFFINPKKTELYLTFENKISISVNKIFNVKNIRPYQRYDFLLITFVDAQEDFNAEYYCIPLYQFVREFKLTYQNGTKESNKNNDMVGVSKSFIKGTDDYEKLGRLNMLKGNSESALRIFLDNLHNNRSL